MRAQCPHLLRLVWECSGGPKNNAPRKTCTSPFWSIFSAFNKSAPRPLFWAPNAPIKSPNRCCGAEEGGNTCREVESNNFFDFWLALNEWIITSPVHHAISQAQDGYQLVCMANRARLRDPSSNMDQYIVKYPPVVISSYKNVFTFLIQNYYYYISCIFTCLCVPSFVCI